ncbi:hypothetical protein Patl1_14793 [Pistacia atlantica]|uniref:Uncharacterized protein n=1 Tax=Pistacia atlantica TaxID=434234 RepID=A0ACC1AW27_9ROSI|nr:hypothetical protein Patl1_14793 [Pistacia atlantica]
MIDLSGSGIGCWICHLSFVILQCAVIQLPSQTLLLSVSDKASRLMGMLLPATTATPTAAIADATPTAAIAPQLQPQQLPLMQQPQQLSQFQQQQRLPQLQQQQQLPQLQQQQQLPHPQKMVGSGLVQGYVQGPRSDAISFLESSFITRLS